MSVWELPAQLWKISRKVDDVFRLQAKTDTALENVHRRLDALETRMTQLESDRGQMITEAKAAAGMAAAAITSNIVSDAITRITRLEMRRSDFGTRLPPPTGPG